MDLLKLTGQVCDLARSVGKFISAEAVKFTSDDIELKGYNNFVTYIDKESEKRLVEGLDRLLPGSGFIAEEDTVLHSLREFTWIIDPLDGTTNYIHHLPIYSVSIALMQDHEIILGAIYEINRDECFYAWKGSNAMLNDHIINVSNTSRLGQAFLATGFPYHDFGRLDQYLLLFKESMMNTSGVRRLGSAAVDLAYVACGRFDGFFEYGLNAWDVAAGSLIVKQAGGLVCNFHGEEDYLFKKEIICTNGFIHHEFMELVNNCFG